MSAECSTLKFSPITVNPYAAAFGQEAVQVRSSNVPKYTSTLSAVGTVLIVCSPSNPSRCPRTHYQVMPSASRALRNHLHVFSAWKGNSHMSRDITTVHCLSLFLITSGAVDSPRISEKLVGDCNRISVRAVLQGAGHARYDLVAASAS